MKRLMFVILFSAVLGTVAHAGPPQRIVLRVIDATGAPIVGAHIMTLEGNADYVRQGIIRSDSTGTAVAEVGGDAFVAFQVLANGFEIWQLDLEPGAPVRKRRVIEVRLSPKRGKGIAIPVGW